MGLSDLYFVEGLRIAPVRIQSSCDDTDQSSSRRVFDIALVVLNPTSAILKDLRYNMEIDQRRSRSIFFGSTRRRPCDREAFRIQIRVVGIGSFQVDTVEGHIR